MSPMRRLATDDEDFEDRFSALVAAHGGRDAGVEKIVAAIIDDLRARGDAALLEYTRRFDGLEATNAQALQVDGARLSAAFEALDAAQRDALEFAAGRIRRYHQHQCQASWSYREPDGTLLGTQVTALERVGVYVPGGKAAYPSSVLMNVIPARVAGVGEVIMTVPARDGELNRLVLAAAHTAGVDRVFSVGGAQAVAALAFGTETVPAVDKIVGPGNAYVAEAKRQLFGVVGIDMIAGPSEILVLCDANTSAEWIAMDLFSQAEHDEQARAMLLCPDAAFIDAVHGAIHRLLPGMERRDIIAEALRSHGALIRVRDLDEGVALCNRIAPEHLALSVDEPERLLPAIRHAGAVFLGHHTPEALGDYCAGPNHVLPTAGTARFSSPLGVYDFYKRTSLIGCSAASAARLVPTAVTLALGEGLTAHARSAQLRAQDDAGNQASKTEDAWVSPSYDESLDACIARVIAPQVRALTAYSVADAHGLIKLDAMENPYPWPPELTDEWLARLRGVDVNRYPDPGASKLKERLREVLAVPACADILLGNGSDELIQLLILAIGGPGSVVLAPDPSFAMYALLARATGRRFESVPLDEADFHLPLDATLEVLRAQQPALTFLAYPNNPTGNLFDAGHMDAILDATPGVVVVDEAYAPFAQASFFSQLEKRPNLLVLRTLSKLGLAGLRLGLLAGAPGWIAELDKLRLPYNLNVLTQVSAELALCHYPVFRQQTGQIIRDRETLYARLAALDGIQVWPSQANFLLLRSLPGSGVATVAALRDRGVLVKNLHGASPLLRDCLRVTVGRPEENAAFLQALEDVIAAEASE